MRHSPLFRTQGPDPAADFLAHYKRFLSPRYRTTARDAVPESEYERRRREAEEVARKEKEIKEERKRRQEARLRAAERPIARDATRTEPPPENPPRRGLGLLDRPSPEERLDSIEARGPDPRLAPRPVAQDATRVERPGPSAGRRAPGGSSFDRGAVADRFLDPIERPAREDLSREEAYGRDRPLSELLPSRPFGPEGSDPRTGGLAAFGHGIMGRNIDQGPGFSRERQRARGTEATFQPDASRIDPARRPPEPLGVPSSSSIRGLDRYGGAIRDAQRAAQEEYYEQNPIKRHVQEQTLGVIEGAGALVPEWMQPDAIRDPVVSQGRHLDEVVGRRGERSVARGLGFVGGMWALGKGIGAQNARALGALNRVSPNLARSASAALQQGGAKGRLARGTAGLGEGLLFDAAHAADVHLGNREEILGGPAGEVGVGATAGALVGAAIPGGRRTQRTADLFLNEPAKYARQAREAAQRSRGAGLIDEFGQPIASPVRGRTEDQAAGTDRAAVRTLAGAGAGAAAGPAIHEDEDPILAAAALALVGAVGANARQMIRRSGQMGEVGALDLGRREIPVRAAIVVGTRRFVGNSHADAFIQAEDAGLDPDLVEQGRFGYVTNRDQFVSRKRASELVGSTGEMDSSQLRGIARGSTRSRDPVQGGTEPPPADDVTAQAFAGPVQDRPRARGEAGAADPAAVRTIAGAGAGAAGGAALDDENPARGAAIGAAAGAGVANAPAIARRAREMGETGAVGRELRGKWFSRLERTAEEKLQPVSTPAQARAVLSKDVAKAEREWTGIDRLLDEAEAAGRQVTREEVLQHLEQNRVRIGETVLGEDTPEIRRLEEESEKAFQVRREAAENFRETLRKHGYSDDQISRYLSIPPGRVLAAGEDVRRLETQFRNTETQLRLHLKESEDELADLGFDTRGQAMNALLDERTPLDAWDLPPRTRQLAERYRSTYGEFHQARTRPAHPEATEALERLREATEPRRRIDSKLREAREKNRPRYGGGYTEPGGENYREILVQLDDAEPSGQAARVEGKSLILPNGERVDFLNREAAEGALSAMQTTGVPGAGAPPSRFHSAHFSGVDNVMTHLRVKDRQLPNGEKVTFIEEVQDDWAQKGRKQGFQSDPLDTEGWTAKEGAGDPASGPVWEVRDPSGRWVLGVPRATASTAEEAIRRAALRSERSPASGRVPDRPFKNTSEWVELAAKRAIQEAVETGSDRIAWTTGQQQFGRYGSERIEWERRPDGGFDVAGTSQVGGELDGQDLALLADQHGMQTEILENVHSQDDLETALAQILEDPEDAPGMAKKLWARMQDEPTGVSMPRKEGMEYFYETIWPKALQKAAKKLGVKVEVEPADIPVGNDFSRATRNAEDGWQPAAGEDLINIPSIRITPELREAVRSQGTSLMMGADLPAALRTPGGRAAAGAGAGAAIGGAADAAVGDDSTLDGALTGAGVGAGLANPRAAARALRGMGEAGSIPGAAAAITQEAQSYGRYGFGVRAPESEARRMTDEVLGHMGPKVDEVVSKQLGVPVRSSLTTNARGWWGGDENPNVDIEFGRDVSDETIQLAAAYHGLSEGQDATTWFRRARKGEKGAAPGFVVAGLRLAALPDETIEALRKVVNGDGRFEPLRGAHVREGQLLFRNFDEGLSHDEFGNLLDQALDVVNQGGDLPSGIHSYQGHFKGGYLDGPEAYLRVIGRHGDGLRSARRLLLDESGPLYEAWAKRVGADPAEVRRGIQERVEQIDLVAREVENPPPVGGGRTQLTVPEAAKQVYRRFPPIGSRPTQERIKLGARRLSRLIEEFAEEAGLTPDQIRDWYGAGASTQRKILQLVQPERAVDHKNVIATFIHSVASNGAQVPVETRTGVNVVEQWLNTGRVSLFEPGTQRIERFPIRDSAGRKNSTTAMEGRRGIGLRGERISMEGRPTAIEASLRKIQNLIDTLGEEKAAEYLTSTRTLRNGRVVYNATEILGPKVGQYGLDKLGFPSSESTIDLWMARMYHQIMGDTPRTVKDRRGTTVLDDKVSPRIQSEMQRMIQAWAEKNGAKTESAQAVAWYAIKNAFRKAGANEMADAYATLPSSATDLLFNPPRQFPDDEVIRFGDPNEGVEVTGDPLPGWGQDRELRRHAKMEGWTIPRDPETGQELYSGANPSRVPGALNTPEGRLAAGAVLGAGAGGAVDGLAGEDGDVRAGLAAGALAGAGAVAAGRRVRRAWGEADMASPPRASREELANPQVRSLSLNYARANRKLGLDPKALKDKTYHEVPIDQGKQIADLYESAPHAPDAPAVKASYDAFKRETLEQYNAAVKAGYKFEPWTQEGQPYANSQELRDDVLNNKHVWYFRSEADDGFGQAGENMGEHPLLERSGVILGGEDAPYNDLFRAIHDLYGHSKEGMDFGPRGEHNAWVQHSRMYSPRARGAMSWETRGQNSWVNFGKHLRREDGSIPQRGDPDYVPLTERPYAEQKVNILPAKLTKVEDAKPGRAASTTLFSGVDPTQLFGKAEPTETPTFKRWFGKSKLRNEDGSPRVLYHGTQNTFTEFKSRPNDIGIHLGTVDQANDRVAQRERFHREFGTEGRESTEGSQVLPVYARIENPVRIPDVGIFDARNVEHELVSAGVLKQVHPPRTPQMIRDELKRKGHDGIVYRNTEEGAGNSKDPDRGEDSYIVFEPTQVKSATGNRGTFDPADPNIVHTPGPKMIGAAARSPGGRAAIGAGAGAAIGAAVAPEDHELAGGLAGAAAGAGLAAGVPAAMATGKVLKGIQNRRGSAGAETGTAEVSEALKGQIKRGTKIQPPAPPQKPRAPRGDEDIDPEEFVNVSKFDLDDEAAEERLKQEVVRVVEDQGLNPKEVVPWSRTKAMATRRAKEMGLDASDVDESLLKRNRLSGVEMLAIRNVVSGNIEELETLSRQLAKKIGPDGEDLSVGEIEQLGIRIARIQKTNDKLLDQFIRARSQTGRDLNNLKILANRTLDPVVWGANAQKAHGAPLSDEAKAELKRLLAKGDRKELVEFVAGLRKAPLWQKVMTFIKAGWLTSPTTDLANLGGNTVMATILTARDVPAFFGDVLLASATGVRTKAPPSLGSLAAQARGATTGSTIPGFKGGAGEALELMGVTAGVKALQDGEGFLGAFKRLVDRVRKADLSEEEMKKLDFRQVNYDNAIFDVYTKGVFKRLGAEDRIFKGIAMMKSLHEQAYLIARAEGLKGAAHKARLKELFEKPTDEMAAQAIAEATYATFQDRGLIAKSLSGLKRGGSGGDPGAALGVAGEFVLPFTTTPANIAERVITFSPVGLASGAAEMAHLFVRAKAGKYGMKQLSPDEAKRLQKRAVERLGSGAVGSVVLWMGYELAKDGLLTTNYPRFDQKEQGNWEATGKQEQAILIDGKWRTLQRVSPVGQILVVGGMLHEAVSNPENLTPGQVAGEAAAGLLNVTVRMSPLQGLDSFMGVLMGERGAGGNFLEGVGRAPAPSIVGRLAKVGDDKVRTADGIVEAFLSRIPGLRNDLPSKVDVLGEEVETDPGFIANVLDPFDSRRDLTKDDPVRAEIGRTGAGLVRLKKDPEETREEFHERQKLYGRIVKGELTKLVRSQVYHGTLDEARRRVRDQRSKHFGRNPREVSLEWQKEMIEKIATRTKGAVTQELNKRE